MSSIAHLNIDFDLQSIFPQCISNYNDVVETITSITNPFHNVCIFIENELKPNNNKQNFHSTCIYLSTYLKHIAEKAEGVRKPYCKYFNFKLKDELNYFQPKCEGEKACYEQMINTSSPFNNVEKVPDSCNGLIQDLDDGTFSLFHMLEGLYYKSNELLIKEEQCPRDKKCFNNYEKLCKMCQDSNNNRLRSLLKDFKDEHLKHLLDAPSCIEPPKYLISYRIRTVLLTSFIITLAMPFIAFILYEYTPCGLSLQSSIRKLKDIWSKKRREEQQLINTFENTYGDLVDKWSKISYGAIDCN